jgi:hypothetical protein
VVKLAVRKSDGEQVVVKQVSEQVVAFVGTILMAPGKHGAQVKQASTTNTSKQTLPSLTHQTQGNHKGTQVRPGIHVCYLNKAKACARRNQNKPEVLFPGGLPLEAVKLARSVGRTDKHLNHLTTRSQHSC